VTRILFFGTSVDHGFWGEEGGWVQRLRRDLDTYSRNHEEDFSLYNLSISGETTERILDRIENEIEAREDFQETHVYLGVGGCNDSQVELETGQNWIPPEEYRENLEKIIEIAHKHAEKVVLFSTRPVDESEVYPMPWKETHGYLNEEQEKYTKLLKEKAEEKELPLVNFSEELEEKEWKEKLYDGVHPDTEGHRQLHGIAKKQLKKLEILPEEV
jgi:lysophospholipase L1-like esterase